MWPCADGARLRAANSVPALAVLGLLTTAQVSAASDIEASAALREAVTREGVVTHLVELQAIADAHAGTRAAGSPGHEASVDYVAGKLREAGYKVRFETFTLPVFQEAQPPRLTVLAEHEELQPRTLTFSTGGTVEGPLWPVGKGRGEAARGCEEEDFEDMPDGAIALVLRGDCWLETKLENAVEADAAAVIIYNREGRDTAFRGDLEETTDVPAVSLGHAAGQRLVEAAREDTVMARLSVDARTIQYPTRNLLAETESGDPDRVVLVGAHLDSVWEGPGINDNASGAAAILEIALQIARLGIETPARLHFAFWSAEEDGLLGSAHHADSLSRADRARLVAALNFDMLASANYARLVYDGNGSASDETGPRGSARIERLFRDYFKAIGLSVAEITLEDDLDQLSFVEHDVPVGGIVAGDGEPKSKKEAELFGGAAGEPYDPCYHAACDTLASINRQALDELSDAAAHVILTLARNPS